MQESIEQEVATPTVDDDAIKRLLSALGEWGVAEVHGEPTSTLADLQSEAMDAYIAASSAA